MGRAARALRTRIGLTGRGWLFLATGSALAVFGVATGIAPAIQFGALVAAVPVLAALLTRSPGASLALERPRPRASCPAAICSP